MPWMTLSFLAFMPFRIDSTANVILFAILQSIAGVALIAGW